MFFHPYRLWLQRFIEGAEKAPKDSVKYKKMRDYSLRRHWIFSSVYLNGFPQLRPLLAETTHDKKTWKIAESNYRPTDERVSVVVIPLLESF